MSRPYAPRILLLLLLLCSSPLHAEHPLRSETYRDLDRVQQSKLTQLTTYMERMRALAEEAGADPHLREYFTIKQRYWQLQQVAPPPPETRRSIVVLKERLLAHYLERYQAFYDILFIDRSGFVLSTVRSQADYHKNLFEGDLAETALAQRLQREPGAAFVDYEFYWVSDEPSAFFVEPVVDAQGRQGWIVLQCSLNRINDIFTRVEGMGRTGETFLVNHDRRMLTDSQLMPGRDATARYLAAENIEAKFRERRGHKRVIDYRGYPALTSFTVCPVLDSEWLLVAKIDEDEVVTRRFRAGGATLRARLWPLVADAVLPGPAVLGLPDDALMVDMDEYRRASDRPLLTVGVATCTAALALLPGGTAYLGHASIHDRIYGEGDMDVLGQMLRTIERFEILPYQLRELEVVLAAPHLHSIDGALDKLLDTGLLLSQIRFVHDPEADSAALFHDPRTGAVTVRWTYADGAPDVWQDVSRAPTLSELVQRAIGYP